MNILNKLISEKIKVFVIPEDDDEDGFDGVIIDYNVEDWYFFEKNEPIQITVNIMPDEYNYDDDGDRCNNISLDRILLSNQ